MIMASVTRRATCVSRSCEPRGRFKPYTNTKFDQISTAATEENSPTVTVAKSRSPPKSATFILIWYVFPQTPSRDSSNHLQASLSTHGPLPILRRPRWSAISRSIATDKSGPPFAPMSIIPSLRIPSTCVQYRQRVLGMDQATHHRPPGPRSRPSLEAPDTALCGDWR